MPRKSAERGVAELGDSPEKNTVAPEKREFKWFERGMGKQGYLLLPG